MQRNVMLTIASLLSILFMTFHLTDDIVRGMEPGTLSNLIAVPILVVWLYGTLVLAERRSGYVIILLGSLLGLVVPVIHMKGAGVGGHEEEATHQAQDCGCRAVLYLSRQERLDSRWNPRQSSPSSHVLPLWRTNGMDEAWDS